MKQTSTTTPLDRKFSETLIVKTELEIFQILINNLPIINQI